MTEFQTTLILKLGVKETAKNREKNRHRKTSNPA